VISQRTLCFLHREGRVLLLHRRRSPNAGVWNGIGGKLEPGEDPYAACIREVREETGLAVADPHLRAVLVVTVQASGDVWILYVFAAPAPPGRPTPSDEGDLRWVAAGQIGSLRTPADLPLLLPHVLTGDGILVARVAYAAADAVEPLSVERLGT